MQAQKPPMTQNRWWRILGVCFVMYVLSYIDRTNLAMAIPSMRTDLRMSATAIGGATSMFFWGYLILQIPTGRLAGAWSAKRVIFVQLLFWAGVSLTTAFVRTPEQLWWNRFALGLAEGGVLTCTIVLIRHWFTRAERARANSMFLLSLAIAPVISSPFSGLVLHYANWRAMFLIEALPGLVWGLVWLWAIADRPAQARWLPEAERDRLEAELAAEAADGAAARGALAGGAVERAGAAARALQFRRAGGGMGRQHLAAERGQGDRHRHRHRRHPERAPVRRRRDHDGAGREELRPAAGAQTPHDRGHLRVRDLPVLRPVRDGVRPLCRRVLPHAVGGLVPRPVRAVLDAAFRGAAPRAWRASASA